MTQATRVGRRGRDPQLRAAVVAAILAGGQHRAVARLYKVSTYSIHRWLRADGVEAPRGIGEPPTCHPSEAHYGRGLCRRCYRREWEREGNVHGPRRKAA